MTESKTTKAKSKQTKQVKHAVEVLNNSSNIKDINAFPIVGIGASAGGLEAFSIFFDATPSDAGIAYILVSHLDPNHSSLLAELLQKHTAMPVTYIENGMQVKPDHVYVIPPNKNLSILNGVLHLYELTLPRGANLPIDSFFLSLAQDQGPNAVCIILSGTGSDGTLGVRAIKTELGLVIAQDEESAKYYGMPGSAISTGLVDFILTPERMAQTLITHIKHDGYIDPYVTNALQKILILIRSRTGHDFSQYKNNTIFRRIQRRMNRHKIKLISDYLLLLEKDSSEINILFKELLIGVTNFFRDPEAFNALYITLIQELKNKPINGTFRVWIPACSTGEEAYSIAIILQECMQKIHHIGQIQVFATDIDEETIFVARKGIYQPGIEADVTPQRLKNFFTINDEDGYYHVNNVIRDMVTFAQQNIIKDPPFSKMDLICCRNLLIYFNSELQRKILSIFNYSLNIGGVLFLGTSESVGIKEELFDTVDKKAHIFRSKTKSLPIINFTDRILPSVEQVIEHKQITYNETEKKNGMQLIESLLRASNAPPCVVIDENFNVAYIHGKVGKYLELAEGNISLNVLDMAHRGLKTAITAAVRNTLKSKEETTKKDLLVNCYGSYVKLNISVKPLHEQMLVNKLMMVVFNEIDLPLRSDTDETKKSGKIVKQLETELIYSKQILDSTTGELQTSNEELKSSNEELQSTNEELQSTNEELETSREELQSLNEESITVNTELQGRIDELSDSNDDIKNLLDNTDIGIIFLDTNLCIRRFTQKMTDIFPLTSHDIGRPLSHLASSLLDINLSTDANQVLIDLMSIEKEVATKTKQHYLLRLRPYRTIKNLIEGVVMTFDDISQRVYGEKELKESQEQLLLAFQATNDAVWDWDLDTGIAIIDVGYNKLYGEFPAEFKDAWQWRMEHIHPHDRDYVISSIKKIIESDDSHWQETFRYRLSNNSYISVIDRAYIIRNAKGKATRMLGAMLDISQYTGS